VGDVSGLDASTACVVVSILEDLAHKGMTVVLSIHQVSGAVWLVGVDGVVSLVSVGVESILSVDGVGEGGGSRAGFGPRTCSPYTT
jgi:hypothetical protein